MNYFTLAFAFLIIAGMIFMAARMGRAIGHNFDAGRRFREAFSDRLKRLRLYRMLQRRGIRPSAYLHQEPIVEIEKHLRSCEGCDQNRRCDRALAGQAGPDTDFSFCPNDAAFAVIESTVNAGVQAQPAHTAAEPGNAPSAA